MTKLDKAIQDAVKEFTGKERRLDALIPANRSAVRQCALAIKHLHTGDLKKARAVVKQLDNQIADLKKTSDGFEHVARAAFQEYAEIKCLLALMEKKPVPSFKELGVPSLEWLTGLCDCVGELRRAMQISLKNGRKKEAEYYFEKMNEIYDAVMTIKFSGSIAGNLKPKQDMARRQVEQARSELLR